MSTAPSRKLLRLASAALLGLLFGCGLVISGMSDPRKVRAFLDIAGNWDPSLAFVMLGAIAVAAPAFALADRRRDRQQDSLLGEPLPATPGRRIDAALILGSVAFGVGWGLAGFCPGPALLTLTLGNAAALVFVGSMLLGVLLHAFSTRGRAGTDLN